MQPLAARLRWRFFPMLICMVIVAALAFLGTSAFHYHRCSPEALLPVLHGRQFQR